jgi:hypothetical protein
VIRAGKLDAAGRFRGGVLRMESWQNDGKQSRGCSHISNRMEHIHTSLVKTI